MSRTPVFEQLPVEIHGQILRLMASPEDVYSTIQASRAALGSFLCFREAILIQVLQTHLPPEIFAEYLGLLRIPKFEDFNYVLKERRVPQSLHCETVYVGYEAETWCRTWSENRKRERCTYAAWSALADGFLKAHFQNVEAARATGSYNDPRTLEKAEVNYMVSTYGMLRRFIRQYQLFMHRTMTNKYPHLLSDYADQRLKASKDWSPLSENETSRLHRGFLRYEIFCCLKIGPVWIGARKRPPYEPPSSLFYGPLSEYLEHWEEEEIRCIWAYFAKHYQDVAQDVVADFGCDVWRRSREARHAPDDEIRIARDITPEDDYDYEDIGYGLKRWEQNMACLGLPLLQQVLQSSIEDQRRFRNNTHLRYFPPCFGVTCMEDKPAKDPEWNRKANHVYNSISIIWPHLKRTHEKLEIMDALRGTGWVFWDDPSRAEFFAFPEVHITEYINSLRYHIMEYISYMRDEEVIADTGLEFSGMIARYPVETMYVTKEDHKELTDKCTAKLVEPDTERFLIGRFRAISDCPSKDVSCAFQEICSRIATTEQFSRGNSHGACPKVGYRVVLKEAFSCEGALWEGPGMGDVQ